MNQYRTRPKNDWQDDEKPLLEGKTVFEVPDIETGLLDQSGNALYRVRPSIGFIRLGQNK